MSDPIRSYPSVSAAPHSVETGAHPVGPEAVLAEAVLELEEQQDRSRRLERRARSAQREAEHKVLAKKRRSARFGAAAGCIQGGLATVAGGARLAAAGASSDTCAQRREGAAAASTGLGTLVNAGLTLGAEKAERAETRQAQRASHRADEAEQHSEDRRTAQRLAERALQHADAILEARMAAERATVA